MTNGHRWLSLSRCLLQSNSLNRLIHRAHWPRQQSARLGQWPDLICANSLRSSDRAIHAAVQCCSRPSNPWVSKGREGLARRTRHRSMKCRVNPSRHRFPAPPRRSPRTG